MANIIDNIEVYNRAHYKLSMTLLEDIHHITVTSNGRMSFSVLGSKQYMGSTRKVNEYFKMTTPSLHSGSQVILKFIEDLYMSNGLVTIEMVPIIGNPELLTIRARDIFEKNESRKP